MKTRQTGSSRRAGAGRQVPLDHLRPSGRRADDARGVDNAQVRDSSDDAQRRANTDPGGQPDRPAEPAEPLTPGGGDADALRGKATRSPADVATRPHLEGSEQGPV
jgi:hypothetical protein